MQKFEVSSVAELAAVVPAVLTLVAAMERQDGAAVLALHGDLGAGKTTFTQALAKHLGVADTVVSPTFVVMKGYATTHETFTQLIHIDAYRIEDVDEMRPLRFSELLAQKDTIICIEWAENIAALLPAHTTHARFTIAADTHVITIDD